MKKLASFIVAILMSGAFVSGQSVFPVKFQSEGAVSLAVVPNGGNADLIVCKVYSDSAVGNNTGLWYFPAFPDSTSKKIFFLPDTTNAQLKISFTSNPANAGWINTAKMYLFNQ